ncbi:MAG: Nif3-like dinuclear metal center hexameric protein [Bacteroidota bacterium]|mgnify:CR=1 FL=1
MSTKLTIREITGYLESLAPIALQESYDNSGLQTGNPSDLIESALVTIDITEDVVEEAISKGAGLIIAHHPLIFGGIKKLTGSNSVERTLLKAIRNNIALYAAHTNLDSIQGGVSTMMANKLGLIGQKILQPGKSMLRKLVTFVPSEHLEKVRQAIFDAGAGHIGNYDQCSYNVEGKGTFRGDESTNPFTGQKGILHTEEEIRLETIFPVWLEKKIINALITVHPYEEVAYDIYPLENRYGKAGMGVTGYLPEPEEETVFLGKLREIFRVPVIRHSPLTGKKINKVALCGGAGSFLLREAIGANADLFITGDMKYHQFFEAENKILIADVGHYESEQFTKELFIELLTKKFSTFALHLSEVKTNPVNYHF